MMLIKQDSRASFLDAKGLESDKVVILWMDKTPHRLRIQQWFLMVLKWCRILSIHSREENPTLAEAQNWRVMPIYALENTCRQDLQDRPLASNAARSGLA